MKHIKLVLAILILIGLAGFIAASLYPDFLWFKSFGYQDVWWFRVSSEWITWIVFTVIAYLWLSLNAYFAKRNSSKGSISVDYPINTPFPFLNTLLTQLKNNFAKAHAEQSMTQQSLSLIVKGLVIFLAVIFGLAAKGWWEDFYLYLNQTPYNLTDPIFGKDITFYLLSLPLFNQIQNWFSSLFVASVFLVGWIYFSKNILLVIFSKDRQFSGIKTHLLILLSLTFLLFSAGTWLSTFDILFDFNGVVKGASYVDVNIIYPLKKVLMVLLALEAVFVLFLIKNSTAKFPYIFLALILLVQVVGFKVVPPLVENLVVSPNELVKQKQYIQSNIKYTQEAYNLSNIKEKYFPASLALTGQDIQSNSTIIDNIRLWNQDTLKDTFSQLQEIRLYYEFLNVDVDRYLINGKPQQVMLSARELDMAQLSDQAQTWINRHLVYTHGYGLCMTPVNKVTENGLPEFYVKDLPPVTTNGLKVTRPGIYFGEKTSDYVVVNTKQQEFDYPKGEFNAHTHYKGKGGIVLNSFFTRLLYAFELSDLKLITSPQITTDSRLIYDRSIQTLVRKIAPFLAFDEDPYLVITDEGHLKWMIDAYTLSNKFPYSEPYNSKLNYIRNSVKVVVDAYNGEVDYYVMDINDPIIVAYDKTYKGMFKSIKNMPATLQAHVRYPKDLFSVQANLLNTYHMNNPEVFYNREDVWEFPKEKYEINGQVQTVSMSPYYIVTKLPGETKERFVLMLPFTPTSKNNMVAWIAASSDLDTYGEFTVLKLPKEKMVYGPMHIESRIDQDTEISKDLTLWGQMGSRVIRGNLMIIPIEESLLYVEPIYLQAETSRLPELKRVIVSYEDKIVMEDNLTNAILALFDVDNQVVEQQDVVDNQTLSQKNVDLSYNQKVIMLFDQLKTALSEQRWQDFGVSMEQLEASINKLKIDNKQ